jgi:outer membrane receptor for ferrienterochelin and colicins
VSGGSAGAFDATTSAAFRHARLSGLFTLEHHQNDGFDLTPTTFDTTGAPFTRMDALGKIRVALPHSWSLATLVNGYDNRTAGRSNGETGPQEDRIDEHTLNAGATLQGSAAGSAIRARVYGAVYSEDSTARLAPPLSTVLPPGSLEERYQKLDASIARPFGARQYLQGGLEWMHDEYAGINRLKEDSGQSATTSVAWAQHRLALGSRVTTTAGVRVDHHSAFGTAVSPKIAANARLGGGVNVRASYGGGFRAPDLGQLNYRFLNPTNFYQVIGNPNLDPEYAKSVQIGAEFVSSGRRARAGVNFFHNDVRDLIESVSLGMVSTPEQLAAILAGEGLDPSFRPVLGRLLFTYKNVNDVATRGVEFDGEAALGRGLALAGAYTLLDAVDAKTDRALTGRNRHQGHTRLSWRSDRSGTRASLRATLYSSWIATRSAAGVDTVAPRFTLVDAYVSQRLVRSLLAFVAADNLADSQDPNTGVLLPNGSPAAIYRPEIGRTLRFGVRWSWNR